MVLNDDYSISIRMESVRELEIIEKHLKRDFSTLKTHLESLTLIIPKIELPMIYDQEVLNDEILKKVRTYFKTMEFIKSYSSTITKFFVYSTLSEKGRMVFEIPNEKLQAELQKILVLTKIFFIPDKEYSLYLPWNSVVLLHALVRFPNEMNEEYLTFMVEKWLPSNTYHKNLSLEIELEDNEEKNEKRNKKENKEEEKEKGVSMKKKSKNLLEFL